MVWELSSQVSKDDIVAALAHWIQRFPQIPPAQ
jgi:hypothetical protein